MPEEWTDGTFIRHMRDIVWEANMQLQLLQNIVQKNEIKVLTVHELFTYS